MKRIIATLLLLVLPGLSLAATTYTAVLEWDLPTQYEDGSALNPADILGYTVHYGKASGSYQYTLPVGGGVTTANVTGLTSGTWFFALTVTSNELEESDFSIEVSSKFTSGKIKKPILRFVRRQKE